MRASLGMLALLVTSGCIGSAVVDEPASTPSSRLTVEVENAGRTSLAARIEVFDPDGARLTDDVAVVPGHAIVQRSMMFLNATAAAVAVHYAQERTNEETFMADTWAHRTLAAECWGATAIVRFVVGWHGADMRDLGSDVVCIGARPAGQSS